MLHIRCGEDILAKLGEAGVPGERVVYVDPVSQGPTPAGLEGDAWRELRAGFLHDAYGVPYDDALQGLRAEDAAVDRAGEHEETVLWFEHDLFDQAILIRLLARFASRPPRTRLSIVSIGEHPEVPRFTGLGNLNPSQLAALFQQRRPVPVAALALARSAWMAYTAPEPASLVELLAADTSALPFLRGALRRHLQELPWIADGLGLTERLALEAVRDGATTAGAAFRAAQEREVHPWLGDAMFLVELRRLAAGPRPALDAGGEWPPSDDAQLGRRVALTDIGRALLEGREDRIRLGGVERWVGGVRLGDGAPDWRWDEARGLAVLRSG